MEGRKQAVWIDHVLSEWLDVNVGVPQGSILGPLLFIVFANDLAHSLSCELDSYADDSTLTSTKDTMEEINAEMNENCALVSKWMGENELCLNADKTHLVIAGTSQRLCRMDPGNQLNITMDGYKLEESEEPSETILGVALQPDLKWHAHVECLMLKLKSRITGLSKVKYVVSLSFRKTLLEGIFNSILTYCMPVWGGTEKGNLQDLQVLQNSAIRHVLHQPPYSSRKELYDQIGCMTVTQLVFYHSMLTVYKIRATKEPEYLFEILQNDNLRGNINIPVTNLSLAMKSFCFRASDGWNDLPQSLRNSPKLQHFKKKLKTWTKDNIARFVE